MSEAIAVVEPQQQTELIQAKSPGDIVKQATEIADVLAGVIESRKLYSMIQGRKYVVVEGWTTLAAMLKVVPREVETIPHEDGHYVAHMELLHMATGQIVGRASAECGGPDEPTWNNREPYTRRSMAQTRATGKACRLTMSWIMALSGFEATPAEEMSGMREQAFVTPGAKVAFDLHAPRDGAEVTLTPGFGATKDEPFTEMSEKNLRWYYKILRGNIVDPTKIRYLDGNKAKFRGVLTAISDGWLLSSTEACREAFNEGDAEAAVLYPLFQEETERRNPPTANDPNDLFDEAGDELE